MGVILKRLLIGGVTVSSEYLFLFELVLNNNKYLILVFGSALPLSYSLYNVRNDSKLFPLHCNKIINYITSNNETHNHITVS